MTNAHLGVSDEDELDAAVWGLAGPYSLPLDGKAHMQNTYPERHFSDIRPYPLCSKYWGAVLWDQERLAEWLIKINFLLLN